MNQTHPLTTTTFELHGYRVVKSFGVVRGIIQPAIKAGLALWPEPLAAAAIGYALSMMVILLLVGRRAGRAGPPDYRGVLWFAAVGLDGLHNPRVPGTVVLDREEKQANRSQERAVALQLLHGRAE